MPAAKAHAADPEFVTPNNAADVLRLGDRRLCAAVCRDLKPAYIEGRGTYYRTAEVRAAIAAHRDRKATPRTLDEEGKELRNELLRVELAKAKGESIPREEAAEALRAVLVELGANLKRRLCVEWPSTCAGLDSAALRAIGEREYAGFVGAVRDLAERWDPMLRGVSDTLAEPTQDYTI